MECPPLETILADLSKPTTKILGRGAQGTVYKVGEFVVKALVIPTNERTERTMALFRAEEDSLNTLSRNAETAPFLPPLCYIQTVETPLPSGDVKYSPYIVQRFEDVMPLKAVISNFTRMRNMNPPRLWGEAVAIPFIDNLRAGLAAIHKAGFLHRDLKPENILVRRDPANVTIPSFIDFGLACRMNEEGFCDPNVIGTPQYVAPNFIIHRPTRNTLVPKMRIGWGFTPIQVRGFTPQFFTKQTDFYSLALIIEEILPIVSWKHTRTQFQHAQELKKLPELQAQLAGANAEARVPIQAEIARLEGLAAELEPKLASIATRERLEDFIRQQKMKLAGSIVATISRNRNRGGSRKKKSRYRKTKRRHQSR